MARQSINIGTTPNDGTGDDLRTGGGKIDANFIELYGLTTALAWKNNAACATTANITLSGEQTIDGVLTAASRVLVKNQSTASQNGIYLSGAGAWARATDADTGPELANANILVSGGTVNTGTQWRCSNETITIGSTNVTFVQVGSTITDGSGTTANGSAVDLGGEITANTLIADNGSGWDFELAENATRFSNIRGYASASINFDGATSTLLQTGDNTLSTSTTEAAMICAAGSIKLNGSTGLTVTDLQVSKTGLKYAASGYANDPLSLMPKEDVEAYVNSEISAVVVGLWNDRGNYDASVNVYPTTGGSGTAGAILKGDIWTISVAGTLPSGRVVEPGDTVRALTNTPGSTPANWAIAQNNIGYTPITNVLTSAQILVGNSSNVAAAVAMTGDISISNTGVTAYATTVPINRGGTNNTSFTTNGVTYYDGTSITSNGSLIFTGSLLGVGLTPTSRLHIQGAAAGTASMVKFQNSTPTVLFDLLESGVMSLTGSASGAGATVYTLSPTVTATANSQTQYGLDINMTLVDGAFTTLTRAFARFRTGGSATNLYDFGTSTFTTTGLTSADLNGGTMRVRNTTGPFNIQGGSGSTDCLRFSGVFTNSVDNHIAFRFTNGGSANSTALHTAGTAITRTWNALVHDWTVSSVNGSTITYIIDKIVPTISVGNSTLTLTGYDYNPDLSATSGTITHYAMRVRSGLSAFGHANAPTSFMDLAAGTTASSSLRIRTGVAPTSPNDGDIWQDGTDLKIRIGGVTKTFTLL